MTRKLTTTWSHDCEGLGLGDAFAPPNSPLSFEGSGCSDNGDPTDNSVDVGELFEFRYERL